MKDPIRSGTYSEESTIGCSNVVQTFVAMMSDAWREFLDAKILYLLVSLIAILFFTVLSGRIDPLPSGRAYLDFSATAMSANLDELDLGKLTLTDIVNEHNGSVYWIVSDRAQGEDHPNSSWQVTLNRTYLPLFAQPENAADIQKRFGNIADVKLWNVREVRETTSGFITRIGFQSWEMTVDPGRDLRLLWPNRFTLFQDSLELTSSKGAPLGLEVFILQKLLTTGLGGSILLLISVAVTAAFVPNMVRKGTLELLLVRPIPRWQILLFKYCGSLLLVAALLGLLIFASWLVTGILADIWTPGVLFALPTLLLFFALLLSVSVLTGVITRSVTSAMLVTVAYWALLFIVGQFHNQVIDSRMREANIGRVRPMAIADSLRGSKSKREEPLRPGRKPFYKTTVGRVSEAIYTVLPHTEDLDNSVDRQLMRDYAVAGPFRALVESTDFSWKRGLGFTLGHTAVFLLSACLIFTRRDP